MCATKCPTCGGPEAHPNRQFRGREVVGGCIDGFHSDAMLHLDGQASAWHWRPEAIKHRAESVGHATIAPTQPAMGAVQG